MDPVMLDKARHDAAEEAEYLAYLTRMDEERERRARYLRSWRTRTRVAWRVGGAR